MLPADRQVGPTCRVLVTIVMIWLLALPASSRVSETRRYTVVVPYKLTALGVPSVEVTVNQEEPVRFLVDTGSAISIVTERVVDKAKLTRVKLPRELKLPWTSKPEGVKVQALGVGGDQGGLFSQIPLIVVPTGKAPFLTSQGLEGILGANFLSQLALMIDPEAGQFKLLYPGKIDRQGVAELGFPRNATPLTKEPGGSYLVRVRINDTLDTDCTLDTGGGASQISAATAKELRLVPVAKVSIGTFVEAVPASKALVDVSVGGTRINGLGVLYPEADHPDRVGLGPGLGMDFLGRVTSLIDFPAGVVYLQQPTRR